MKYDLKYISLGEGVQSPALYLMSCNGDAEKADVAIFADTGDEPTYVYEYLEYLKTIGRQMIRDATCVVANSDLELAELPPNALSKAVTVPNGVAAPPTGDAPPRPSWWPATGRVVSFVGRISPETGLDWFLEAWSFLPQAVQ